MKTERRDHVQSVYQHLFHPRSIAVIGASNDAFKPGGRVLKTIKDHGYKGELWAVNPKTADVQQVSRRGTEKHNIMH